MNDVDQYGFKSCISHCLKTPLQKILGFLLMYEHGAYGVTTEEGVKAAKHAEDAVWYQDKFVTYLLQQLSEGRKQDGKFILELDAELLQEFYEKSITPQ